MLFVSGLPRSWTNGVVDARLDPEVADARIAWVAGVLREAGVPASWSIGPSCLPADLGDRLATHGFRGDEVMPWMVADLADLPEVDVPSGFVIDEVRTPALHEPWLEAITAGFGSGGNPGDTLDRLGRHEMANGDGSWTRFLGRLDGRPVATAGLILAGGAGGIYSVATAPSARRRGLGGAMTLAAMRHARDRGYPAAVLGASELGRGVYESLGFREVCTIPIFSWEPSA